MRKSKGFTLIELLIVIAVLGILVVAILSALDPLEQIRKARDSGKKSDAAELLAAYERYFTTYQCYPWESTGTQPCENVPILRTAATNPDFTSSTEDYDLINQGELKAQFANRESVDPANPAGERLWVSEAANSRQVSVCYEPESRSARQGGLGPTRNITNSSADTCAVPGSYPDTSCFVCVPQ
jgi:prepilin-type N-terminal cleavage/methylation domain-containing protein